MVLISRVTGKNISFDNWVQEQLEQLIKTNKGEFIYNNEWGSDIPSLVGKPNSEEARIQARVTIANAVREFIPQIKLVAVDVGYDSEADYNAGRIRVRIRYANRANGEVALFEGDL